MSLAWDAMNISIHAPREGGDIDIDDLQECMDISIHAPREGGDAPASWATPRSPGFQSTPPARGATMIWMIRQVELVFQSTPPARGATPRWYSYPVEIDHFNPRPPRGGRRYI